MKQNNSPVTDELAIIYSKRAETGQSCRLCDLINFMTVCFPWVCLKDYLIEAEAAFDLRKEKEIFTLWAILADPVGVETISPTRSNAYKKATQTYISVKYLDNDRKY